VIFETVGSRLPMIRAQFRTVGDSEMSRHHSCQPGFLHKASAVSEARSQKGLQYGLSKFRKVGLSRVLSAKPVLTTLPQMVSCSPMWSLAWVAVRVVWPTAGTIASRKTARIGNAVKRRSMAPIHAERLCSTF
jgi:hypothetical protein